MVESYGGDESIGNADCICFVISAISLDAVCNNAKKIIDDTRWTQRSESVLELDLTAKPLHPRSSSSSSPSARELPVIIRSSLSDAERCVLRVPMCAGRCA